MEDLELNNIPDEFKENATIAATYNLFEKLDFGSADSICIAAKKHAMLTEEWDNSFGRQLREAIAKLNFTFFYAIEDEFITSDSPVCIGDDPLIQCENKTCIFFALTPKVAVLFGNYPRFDEVKNKIVPIDRRIVNSLNIRLASRKGENRFLLGRSEDLLQRYTSYVE